MKKWLSLLVVVALLASFTVMPASAAEELKAKVVLGFESLTVGATVKDADAAQNDDTATDAEKWANIDHVDTVDKWSGTVVAEGGHSGKALKLTQMRFKNANNSNVEPNVMIKTDVTDWTGGTDLYFYVDATGWEEARIMIRVENTLDDGSTVQFVPRHLRKAEGGKQAGTMDTFAYTLNSKGEWAAVTTNWYGRFQLPANYKGWVKIPLNMTGFMPQWWGDFANAQLSLDNVTGIAINIQDTQSSETSPAIFDSFAVGGVDGADITIIEDKKDTTTKKDDTTTTTKKADATTAAGATTGEAAPIAAAVTLVVAAGAVVALRKRSK